MNSKLLAACGTVLLLAVGAQAQSVDTIMSTNLFEPHGLATDGSNIYITDGGNGNCVVKIGMDGTLASVVGRAGTSGMADGSGNQARFNDPQGVVFVQGKLYVADAGNNALRVVDLTSNRVSTVPGSTGQLSYPTGLATDGTNVYIADYGNGAVEKYDTVQSKFTTVVSDAVGWPSAVAVGDNGDLWIADAHNSAIYRVSSTGTNLIAGIPGNIGTNDALNASEARLNGPRGLLWRSGSGLLISDTGNNAIRRLYWNTNVDVMDWSLETVAGIPGQVGNADTLALSSTFNSPMGLTPDLYTSGFCIADSANKVIRRYRQNSTPIAPVDPPRIGYVQFVVDPTTKEVVSSFVDATDTTMTFYTTTNIVIYPEKGTQTYFTYGPTPTDAFNDTVPNPNVYGTNVVPYPGDGLSYANYIAQSPTIISNGPIVTIKAVSRRDGQPSSSVVSANFKFVCGPASVSGQNSASLVLNDITSDAGLWYTLDGSNPTNSTTVVGPVAPGTMLSFPITGDTLIQVIALKDKFTPSAIYSQMLYTSNYLANRLTFGFETNQEASSYFYGAPGQTFFAPITLSLMSGQTMYSLQFNVTVTNAVPAYAAQNFSFDTMLLKNVGGFLYPIPPMFADTFGGTMTNLLITNASAGLLGVGWLERYGATNLYDTKSQDLITYSMAHDHEYLSKDGKVVVGAYQFKIPNNAPADTVYQIQLGAASATADGVDTPALMQLPTNSVYSSILSIKQIKMQPVPYLVGSVVPFRWFNAGDFGSNTIQNADVLQVFTAACYGGLSRPDQSSDLFDAMDSSDGYTNARFGNDQNINNVSNGDGQLLVDDVYVTFRRSVDPTLTNYYRYMSAGARIPIATNSFLPTPAPMMHRVTPAAISIPVSGPHSLRVVGTDLQSASSQTVQIPITAQIQGDAPVRVLMMNITVQPLDGAPALTTPIAFSESGMLVSSNKLSDSTGPNNFSAAWLDATVPGVAGTNLLGTLTVTLPDGLSTNAAYLVHFDHFSASPNGLGIFPATVEDTLITVGNRTTSSWNDAIPDAWRLRYFGTVSNLLSADAADADGDGASNLNEYQAGTNPMDAKSKLQVLGPAKPDGTNCVLQWPTVASKQYVIEWANSLFATNWAALSTNLTGDGTMHQFIDTNVTDSARFYRVRLAQ